MWHLRGENDRTFSYVTVSLLVAGAVLIFMSIMQAMHKQDNHRRIDPNGNPLETVKVRNEAVHHYPLRQFDGLAPKYIRLLGERVVDAA